MFYMEVNYNFIVQAENRAYIFDISTTNNNIVSGHQLVPADETDRPAILKLFEAAQVDESFTVEMLADRLKSLPGVSHVDVKVTDLFQSHFPQQSSFGRQNINTSELIRMVRKRTSDADNRALCRKCLIQNNNNPKLALNSLKNAFRLAGAGPVSERMTEMLESEASNRNVDEIKAFGRKRTVDVVGFLKDLPQTADGAIDLTRMKRIGQGGTQDVYILKDRPSPFVIKVNRASKKMITKERLEKFEADHAAYRELHDSFGDYCTVEQLLLRNIADGSSTKGAIISIADFESGFTEKSKIGLWAPNFVWDPNCHCKKH